MIGKFFSPGTTPNRQGDIRGVIAPESLPPVGALKAISTTAFNTGDAATDLALESLRAAVLRDQTILRGAQLGR